ncbi:MAG: hypothetical protein EHM42_09425, partial [Planctomycetaceae bacterium]
WLKSGSPAWRTEIPGAGLSQPILFEGSIYLTTAIGPGVVRPKSMQSGVTDPSTMGRPNVPKEKLQFQLLKLDPRDGSIVWARTVAEKIPTIGTHASNSYATETPCAADGKIYAYFGATGDLAAFDTDGKELWKKDFGPQQISNQFGTGASPAIHDGRLFLPRFNEKEGRIVCLDAATGAEQWSSQGKEGTSWATPVIWSNQGTLEVVAGAQGMVAAYDLATGVERWRVTGLDTSFSCSVVADDAGVYFGTSSPGSKGPIYAIAAGHQGDLSLRDGKTQNDGVRWSKTKSGAGMPSPVLVGDLLYFFGSTVTCYEKGTGVELYRKRMPEGQMAAGCPLVVGDKILIVNEQGRLLLFNAGREFADPQSLQVGSENEVFWATPALADNTLLVRSSEALYCLRGE